MMISIHMKLYLRINLLTIHQDSPSVKILKNLLLIYIDNNLKNLAIITLNPNQGNLDQWRKQ